MITYVIEGTFIKLLLRKDICEEDVTDFWLPQVFTITLSCA